MRAMLYEGALREQTIERTTFQLIDHGEGDGLKRYEVRRFSALQKESRFYSDYGLAYAEWFRQSEEEVGYRLAFVPNYEPTNDHQRNGVMSREEYEEEQRRLDEEMHLTW